MRFVLVNALTGEETDFDRVSRFSTRLGGQRSAPAVLPGDGRLVQSHERYRALIPAHHPRVLYIVRDGRDVAVSYYYHNMRQGNFDGDFGAFTERLLAGAVDSYGTWHGHVLGWTERARRQPQQVSIVRYEDLLADPVSEFLQISRTFELGLTHEQLVAAIHSNSAAEMRAKESASSHLRVGQVQDISFVRSARAGQWREMFDDRLLKRFEAVAGHGLLAAGYELSADARS